MIYQLSDSNVVFSCMNCGYHNQKGFTEIVLGNYNEMDLYSGKGYIYYNCDNCNSVNVYYLQKNKRRLVIDLLLCELYNLVLNTAGHQIDPHFTDGDILNYITGTDRWTTYEQLPFTSTIPDMSNYIYYNSAIKELKQTEIKELVSNGSKLYGTKEEIINYIIMLFPESVKKQDMILRIHNISR